MKDAHKEDFIIEPSRERPILLDADVAVVGAGISGVFAAIAAGRCGARTVLIDRCSDPGGNIGPGMIKGGGLDNEAEVTLPGGTAGIAKEFMDRLQGLLAPRRPGDTTNPTGPGSRYPEQANIATLVLRDLLEAAGVRTLFSAYASDPIMDGSRVRGLFVENSSGRQAVRAEVTIDATGIADVARRAGATIIPFLSVEDAHPDYIRAPYRKPETPTYWNDSCIQAIAGGVDLNRFASFRDRDVQLTGKDKEMGTGTGPLASWPDAQVPALRRAWEEETFRPHGEFSSGVKFSSNRNFSDYGGGVVGFKISCTGSVDAGDYLTTRAIEDALRDQAIRYVLFLRDSAEGWEQAYIITLCPYIGWRGGPHIEGDHVLTPEEAFEGLRGEDVLYRNTHEKDHGGEAGGFDVPYRICLPKGVDGLLACGRSAAYLRRGHDPTGMRARPSMMVFGQTVGTAAAVAALDRVSPREVDIRKVQKRLVADGIILGEEQRLRELGLK